MSPILEALINQFGSLFIPALLAAAMPWLGPRILKWLDAIADKTTAHADAQTNEIVKSQLQMLGSFAITLGNSLEQTVVAGMVKNGEWGKPEAYAEVAKQGLAEMQDHAKAAMPQLVSAFGDGLGALCKHLLEHAVSQMPETDTSSAPAIVTANPQAPALPAKP